MSIQGTFNTAVQAMQAQTQFLNNISMNIANVNTTAYKLQDTHFATLLNHVKPTDKKFFTVNTFDVRQVDKQGVIATTNRNLDLALNGRGFIVTNTTNDLQAVNNPAAGGTWQFTRDGALFGKAIDLGTDTDGNGVSDQGTMLITANGSYVYGWAADENGNFTEANTLSSLTPVMYGNNSIFPSKATSTMTVQANLSASDTGRQNISLPFVDQSGNSRSLVIGFNAQMGQRWTLDMSSKDINNMQVDVTFDTGDPTSPFDIQFDGNGKLVAPLDGMLNVSVDEPGVGPQSFTVDISKITQFSDNGRLTVVNTDHDGYIAGRLQNTYFNSHGVLIGSYTNGELKNLYKLPVATFMADNKMEARPGNIFAATQEAGEMRLSGLGTPTGTTHFVTGALEQSNVDLADQFSKMIITQRAYSSAAKVLTTADEMTQAARDLKR